MTDELYKRAHTLWGTKGQTEKAIEECAEFIVAASHWWNRFRSKAVNALQLAEEIADVMIMMEQMANIVGREAVQQYKDEKLDRLRELIQLAEAEV